MSRFDLIGLNCRYSHSCLALFYVRHAIEENVYSSDVRICQYTINDPYYDILLKVSASKADVLFFSVYIWNGPFTERLVRDLVQVQPERPMILGGPQAPFLKDLPPGCTVIKGEIEGVDERFYRDLEEDSLQPLYGSRSGETFPFPYRDEDFSGELRNRLVYYESSRGCPFRCSYCLSSVRHGVQHKNTDVVEEELLQILAHEPKIIKFVDRTFNDDPERTLRIWRFLESRPEKTRYHFEIAPDRFTEEMFIFLETVATDRFQFEIGIQSTNPETLAAISRNMDVDKASENIARLVALDSIHLHVDLILGLPHETEETFHRSFNRVFSLQPHYIQMGLLKVLPETPISSEADEHGLIFCQQPPYQVLATHWLDHRLLNRLYGFGECVESFYNNRYFLTIWWYLIRQQEEPVLFFRELLRLCHQHHFFDLAPTQELMTRILSELAGCRPDRDLLQELLCYDWLRCGHRFLPDFLEIFPSSLSELRIRLRKELPPSIDGLYQARDRSVFIKKGVFAELSAAALAEIGLGDGTNGGLICFRPEKTPGVKKVCQVVLVEGKG